MYLQENQLRIKSQKRQKLEERVQNSLTKDNLVLDNIQFLILLANDDIILGLVHNRLNKTDCLVQGFVLDGFPKNQDQVDMIDKMKIQPSFVVVLEASDEEVTETLRTRRIDPVTGNIYEKDGSDAQTQAIFDRLQPLSNSHPKKIEQR